MGVLEKINNNSRGIKLHLPGHITLFSDEVLTVSQGAHLTCHQKMKNCSEFFWLFLESPTHQRCVMS